MNYLDALADAIRREVPESALPNGDTADLFRLYAVLTLVKGAAVTREDVHNAWAAWMSADDPTHEAIKPYDELVENVQREDQVYVEAIRTVASRRV